MAARIRTKQRIEYGDFQTPESLARQVCRVLARERLAPAAVVEPTCGRGAFLVAAAEAFPSLQRLYGLEIEPAYAHIAREAIGQCASQAIPQIQCGSFFETDWAAVLGALPEPLLVIGNPPWVTNSVVGALNGSNLPQKSNLHQLAGLAALTGKSNFDISEWMLIQLLNALQGRRADLAMLCKTAVARKVLAFAWKHRLISQASIRLIDASKHFGATVDAAMLLCRLGSESNRQTADVFTDLETSCIVSQIGYVDDRLVADLPTFKSTRDLEGSSSRRWRSGVKHDCARVMEFHRVGDRYQNGLGEVVELEPDFLYPMLKSSDLAAKQSPSRDRWMLVTQRSIGEETSTIQQRAPKTWSYLLQHQEKLDGRASSIYRNRPRYSVFGVGSYSFALHKVAISGLYKHIRFRYVGPCEAKPTVLDDTCMLLPCLDSREARFIVELLDSPRAHDFFRARIFWDSKRPILADVLNELDLQKLAREVAPDHPVTAQWIQKSSQTLQRQLF